MPNFFIFHFSFLIHIRTFVDSFNINQPMISLKEKWQQFCQWQRKPIQYKPLTDEKHVCLNCGQEFVGVYCPRCSQSSKVEKHISWSTISSGFLEAFNIEGRSFPRALWHLVCRPGYMIGDYISGHRQMSYPPLKMLVIIALCLVIVESLPEWLGWNDVTEVANADDTIERIAAWAENNPAWSTLALCSVLILPTWSLFRYAPRHSHHTLPEGFFIQVFMATLILLIFIISDISNWFMWLILFYYVVTYHQLFGYSLWGTFWRILVGMFEVIQLFIVAICLNEIKNAILNKPGSYSFGILLAVTAIFFLLGTGAAYIAHRINKRHIPTEQE